ncbi:putative Pentatricopeptide repeat-containing protein [Melia azedarach]|uniref:Pentatricopeptide repeat-containing protein n=1 Tax=Melia azedarach TaxID=155640 RepID=A0ACC1YSD3_MELAZ|nr:putative Pentatricopeptide repeat-containing protein [Melia azedarach]
MRSLFRPLKTFSRENLQRRFKSSIQFTAEPTTSLSHKIKILNPCFVPIDYLQGKNCAFNFLGRLKTAQLVHSLANSDENTKFQQYPDDEIAIKLQSILKNHENCSKEEIERALDQFKLKLTDDLVLDVFKHNRFDWKPAYIFFRWVSREGNHLPGSGVYNQILDILGRARRFEELVLVFDEMSERKGLVNEQTYGTLLNRYAAAHKVEEAIGVFNRRKEFGIEVDLVAFHSLLMWLCRYKHVEAAETFFVCKNNEFGFDIKAMNIILNGWCVLGNVREAKRFWKDIIASKCELDLFTYGTFINALTKKGKLGTAMRLFRAMWEKSCKMDVAIFNCIIDALCFKKRIPEALEVFREMSERCLPNVTTYNSLIKHLCKIQRMEKVYELLNEMEQKSGSCLPNDVTFNYLLKSLKKPEEVPGVLERMERNGCKINSDTYNLILKLYVNWDYEEKVKHTWDEMEKKGVGPDQRSYTIMIHGLYDKGKLENALFYFHEMTSKGMVPEPRTEILVNDMTIKLKERGELGETGVIGMHKRKRKMKSREYSLPY